MAEATPDRVFPAGTLVEVTAEIRMRVAATEKQIRQYLEYTMTESGGCDLDNPLLSEGIDPWDFECEFTGYVGREEEFDSKDMPDGSREYKVRRIRERLPT